MSPAAWIILLSSLLAAAVIVAVRVGLRLARDSVRAEDERDAALRDKAATFEAWQSEVNKLRADLALLRPIADAAEALCDGKNLPGEFGALREAIRARKEAGNA